MDEKLVNAARDIHLPAYLSQALGLRYEQRGSSYMFSSPFREEGRPSLHVSQKNGTWLWFDHGDPDRGGGDGIALLTRMGYSFTDSVTELARFEGTIEEPEGKPSKPPKDSNEKKMDARKVYLACLPDHKIVERYFDTDNGLLHHPEMECRVVGSDALRYLKKLGYTKLAREFGENRYIAIPCPNRKYLKSLEFREMTSGSSGRRVIGEKTLWFLEQGSDLLITESVLDCLAGEILLWESHDDLSLLALNGVGQARKVEQFVEYKKPARALLALDNDDPGRRAEEIIRQILQKQSIPFESVEFSEKDLHRELRMQNEKTGDK